MSFTAPIRVRTAPTLPLAAMVDILFLLLVFFLTAAAFREQDRVIEVVLPGTETDLRVEPATPIVITVDAEGRTFIGDRSYTLDELTNKLAVRASQYPDEWIDIRGDAKATHGRIVRVLDMITATGLHNVRMHTRPIDGGQ